MLDKLGFVHSDEWAMPEDNNKLAKLFTLDGRDKIVGALESCECSFMRPPPVKRTEVAGGSAIWVVVKLGWPCAKFASYLGYPSLVLGGRLDLQCVVE